jgi:hypothetical protein
LHHSVINKAKLRRAEETWHTVCQMRNEKCYEILPLLVE